jgi:tRNA1Val (adenine37-N6)-methyltransferase
MTPPSEAAVAQGDGAPPDLTVDTLFEGRLELYQRRGGSRFGIDALLLAGTAHCRPETRLLDLGCGNGVVALAMLHLWEVRRATGLEIQPQLAELARLNAARNDLTDRFEVRVGDVRRIRDAVAPQTFDLVVCNPPYYPSGSGRLNPDSERAAARHELRGTLADFLRAAHHAVVARGVVQLIYPASRLTPMLEAVKGAGFVPQWLQFVHPETERRAQLVLCRARRGGAPALSVRPPLVLEVAGNDGGREPSPSVRELLSGRPIPAGGGTS